MPESRSSRPGHPRLPDTIVHGAWEPGYDDAITAFARLFSTGRGGGALAVYHQGRPVVDIWTGSADLDRGVAWQSNTAALSYSTSKGITATVLHRLAEQGLIDYHAPVAEYWPEFGVNSKKNITVADVLTHRAGLSHVAPLARNLEELVDHHLMEERIAAAAPDRWRGIPAYHAISFGWLAAGIARAVTGKGMGELYRTELAEPLQIDGLHLGTPPPSANVTVAVPHGSQVPFGIPDAARVLRIARHIPAPGAGFIRAIYTHGVERVASGTDPAILLGESPAANGVFTARAIAAVYDGIATDRLLPRSRVRRISRVQTWLPDRNLLLPMGWRLGYHSIPTPGAPRGFGHIGLAGSGGWTDPDTGLSVGLVHNWLPEAGRLPCDQVILPRLLAPIVRAASGTRHTDLPDLRKIS
ncbi:serine hydrolase domain-containing protein [Nocardia aurantiaca]|uniref:Serine hydrolase n=1 Tax=Nocardia aurantiaca TaxID=2675850 RepID=A0A6I3KW85_9NOCA|nr:serine hydrolase domain-containing protein [Nocardia aurantiaca]MTE13096.1 serine hydrolase [Nocardia aurantiaca]